MKPNTGTVIVSAVVALAAGLGLGACGSSSKSSSSSSSNASSPGPTGTTAADTRPISLPASLDGYRDAADAMAARGTKASIVSAHRKNEAAVAAATQAAYSRAYGGAASAFRNYSDAGLSKFPYVIAVRAAAPGLTIGPVQDPKFLGLATPEREVKAVGAVQCQIDWSPPTVAGQTPAPSSELVVACQRSEGRVSVFVAGGGFAGPAGLAALVGLTNSAFSAASAS